MSRKLKVSVNPNIFNKTPNSPMDWSMGFDTHELILDELSEIINFGFTFSYVFKGGVRKTDNFISSDLLCIDMDGDRTIKETLNDDIVKKYGSLFYTTPSHTPDVHRFRIIFVLPRTLTDVTELKQSMTSLSRRLGGDMSVVDGGRLFFGSHNSNPTILGKSISDKYL
ncbi:signal recognition particle, partial [Candidatus Woesearchaeota archaeon]|nr:signal recognition particle [Candidatus Woesearchaeota archaeon]